MRMRAPARSSMPEAVITEKLQGGMDGGRAGGGLLRRRLMHKEKCHAAQSNGAARALCRCPVPDWESTAHKKDKSEA